MAIHHRSAFQAGYGRNGTHHPRIYQGKGLGDCTKTRKSRRWNPTYLFMMMPVTLKSLSRSPNDRRISWSPSSIAPSTSFNRVNHKCSKKKLTRSAKKRLRNVRANMSGVFNAWVRKRECIELESSSFGLWNANYTIRRSTASTRKREGHEIAVEALTARTRMR